jgi:SnoaL-like domain
MDDDGAISLEDATCLVRRALLALAVGDVGAIDLFTEDVIGESPIINVRSRSELANQLLDRSGGLSNVEFELDRVEMIAPDTVVASIRVAGDFTGEVLFNDDLLFGPTGQRIHVVATSRMVIRQRRIAKFQTFYDDENVLDQFRGAPRRPETQ